MVFYAFIEIKVEFILNCNKIKINTDFAQYNKCLHNIINVNYIHRNALLDISGQLE